MPENENEVVVEDVDASLEPTEEELKNQAVFEFYEAFNNSFKQEEESPVGDFLFKELKTGQKTIYNKTIRETKIFDSNFIDILRAAYPSLIKIVRDPKKTIKYEQEVVAMEKAKKFNADSVRHLASHTQYIKSVDQTGFVTPSKILTTFSDDDLGMYENVFIKSLINKVIRFLEVRYDLMNKNLESYQAEMIKYTNNKKVESTTFDVEINVKVSRDLVEETSTAKKILYDVDSLLNLYRGLKGTPLYQAVAKKKDILPPIMKTNIIMHNPDFKIAYNTWIYLDRSMSIGYNVDTKERKHTDSEKIALDFDKISTVLLATVLHHRGIEGYGFKNSRGYKRLRNSRPEVTNEQSYYGLTPKDIKLEHQEVSEYLLNQTADFYGKSLDQALEQGLSYEMSIKKVYREMLDVLNSIYPKLFVQDNEAFEIKSSSEEKLEEAKKQLKVMKMVREQKQIDLRKMDRSLLKTEKQVQALIVKVRNENRKKLLAKVKEEAKARQQALKKKAKKINEKTK